jgi:hypothetical protein
MRPYFPFLTIVALAVLITGCNLARRSRKFEAPQSKEFTLPQGKGDAFLYDLKIYHHGKKNSVRLDVYRTDDSIAIFARGYLGKGALKGIIKNDSILAYFPTEDEFYSGPIAALINDPCVANINFERSILSLFRKLPTEIESGLEDFYITIADQSSRGREFRLTSRVCNQEIRLEYDFRNGRYVPLAIEFEVKPQNPDEKPFGFSAKRREQRLSISIPAKKFELEIPDSASRIAP